MDTQAFFERVLARQGLVCLLTLAGDRRRQAFFKDHAAAAKAAVELDGHGATVYHGCATFRSKDSRKQENAAFMRSFWIDLDVDPANPAKYPDLKTALIDLGRVARELDLPFPLIVKSGNGAHGYFLLTEDVPAPSWAKSAALFKAVLDHLGIRQDRTRTADSSSVLRPVGTHWRKDGVRRVEALSDSSGISFADFVSRLEHFAHRNQLLELRLVDQAGDSSDDLSAGIEYPPSSADRIVDFCPTLAHVAAQRGNVSEPLWRAMLGLVKFTVEGVQRCHDWSAGHPEYDQVQTQEKIDRWAAAPTTCAHFRDVEGNQCTGCPRNVTSPIQLGYIDQGNAPAAIPAPSSPSAEPAEIPYWPKESFHWNGRSICRAVRNADGGIEWVAFCDTKFYPVARIRDEQGDWQLMCRYEKRNGQVGEFALPTELLGKQGELHAALAAKEIVMTGPNGIRHGQELLRQHMLALQQANIEHLTYTNCGWADDYRSFIVGNRRITAVDETEILGGERIRAAGWNTSFGQNGAVDRWVELVNTVYNRPGAEPYQFVILTAFASPLVELLQADNWHGIPVALVGPTGLGKTTACRLACSIYGKGDIFQLNAEAKQGSTTMALLARTAIMKSLPLLFDEITKRDPTDMSEILYALSNGRPRDRVDVNGKIVKSDHRWNLLSFVTSNNSIVEALSSIKHSNIVEATQIRVFEIALSEVTKKLWPDVNWIDIVEHQLGEQYGKVGRIWLPHVIKNAQEIRDGMRKLRVQLGAVDSDQTRERFYRDLSVHILVAGQHARKLGLIDFDIVNLAKWTQRHIASLRQVRTSLKVAPSDRIAHFLGSLHGRIILTQHFSDGRGVVETPLEVVRGSPLARMALQDKIFIVTARAINEWCAENEVAPSWLIEQMRQRDLLVHRPSDSLKANGSRKERLARGTSLPSAPEYVFELDYSKVAGQVDPKGEEK